MSALCRGARATVDRAAGDRRQRGCCSRCTCSCSSISKCWWRTGWRTRHSVQVMEYTLVVTVWRSPRCWPPPYLRDVEMIFVTIVCAEALKNSGIYVWLRRRGLLVFRWDHEAMREQIRLVAPLGAGSMLNKANEFGKRGGGQPDGPGAAGDLHHRGLPGAAGEHRADLAGGRDLSRHGQARAARSGAGPAAVETRADD